VFGELPRLFGRDFTVGFLLPLAAFLACGYVVASSFAAPKGIAILKTIDALKDKPTLLGATISIVILWLGGVTLLVFNYWIIRFKEGYGRWNPFRILKWMEVARFRRLHRERKLVDSRREALLSLGLTIPPDLAQRRRDLHSEAAERFPDGEEFLLPTAFGNTIRAWERYPMVMYGIDAIPSWNRLLLLIPENQRSLIDQDKAAMDFWLNLWLLSLVLFMEYAALALMTRDAGSLWVLTSLIVAVLASRQARGAALIWGEGVKAAFDLYLPELRTKLRLREDLRPDQEREQWTNLSRAMAYRNPDALPPRQSSEVDGLRITREEGLKYGRGVEFARH
jgi:hypothetical protein